MTNAELLAKIKAEIERLYEEYKDKFHRSGDGYHLGLIDGLDMAERVLDTLEEPVCEELNEELDRFIASGKSITVDDYGTYKVSYHDFKKIARHFAEWQKAKDDKMVDIIYQQGIEKGKDEMREQSVCEDLNEAAKAYTDARDWAKENYLTPYIRQAFIAGAKWQADHTPLPEDTVLFNKGVAEGKRLIMEGAVEGDFMLNPYPIICLDDCKNYDFKEGDKVKLIICKED